MANASLGPAEWLYFKSPLFQRKSLQSGKEISRYALDPGFRVQPDGNFFAEAKALLGDAALIA